MLVQSEPKYIKDNDKKRVCVTDRPTNQPIDQPTNQRNIERDMSQFLDASKNIDIK